MKRIAALILIEFLSVQADIVHSVSFTPDDFEITKQGLFGVNYDLIRIEGGVVVANPGEPAIPARVVHLVLPEGQTVVSAEAIVAEKSDLPGQYVLFPAQIVRDCAGPETLIGPDSIIYNSNILRPAETVRMLTDGCLGGYHILSLLIHPVQYIPAQKKLVLSKKIMVTVKTEPAGRGGQLLKRRSSQAEDFLDNFVEKLVANPEDVALARPNIEKSKNPGDFFPTQTPSPDGSPVEYLIVTSQELMPQFQILADWKTKRGIPAVVRTTDWVYRNYSGCDRAEQIRNFLIDAYTNWGTIWVLLGGDVDVMPYRNAHEPISHPYWPTIACDYYFSDLDGNWNFNGNSLFGELADSCDMYPDVFVGRASVSNQNSATVFVDKIIQYEKAAKTDYQLKVLMLAAWIDQFTNNAIGKHDYIVVPYIPARFQVTELYQQAHGSRQGLNRTLAIDALNSGYNIINQVDHTGIYNIGVGTSAGELLYRPDFDQLFNNARTGILFSCGCNVSAFNLDCIGEHFLSNPNGGGVAFIGSSRAAFLASGSPGRSPIELYDQNFFEALLVKNSISVGAALALAKAKLSHLTRFISYYRYSHYALNLLGDPQMPIWTDTPKRMQVTYVDTILLAPMQYTVTVTESVGANPEPDCRVILWKKGEFYLLEMTDAQGRAVFDLAPEDTGGFDIVAVKENRIPFEGKAIITQGNQSRLCYHSCIIDDDSIPPSQGNGNSLVDAGETVEVSLALKNNGSQIANGVDVFVSCANHNIQILNNQIRFPDIPPGEIRFSIDRLVFQSYHRASTFKAVFRMDGYVLDTFQLPVYVPALTYTGNIIDDRPPGGNGNGLVEPEETVLVFVKLRNSGNGVANGVKMRLAALDTTMVIIPPSEITIGNLNPGQDRIASSPFKIYTTQEYLSKDRVSLTTIDNYNRSQTSIIKFKTILTPTNIFCLPAQFSIELQWDSVPGAIGYNLYRKDSPTDSFFKLNNTIIKNVSVYEDRFNINCYSTYFYKISAVDSFLNESQLSAEVTGHTNPPYLSGWPVETAYENGFNPSSGAVVDLEGDGDYEYVIGAGTKIFAWHDDGNLVSGWPVEMGNIVFSSPAVADINQDGRREIIIGNSNYVYVLGYDGSQILKLTTDGNVVGVPIVFDVDQDSRFDIVTQTQNSKLYAWHADGTIFPAFPITLPGYPGYTSPAIGDLDDDGFMEMVCGFVKQWQPPLGGIIAYNHDGTVVPGWELIETNGVIYLSSPAIADIDDDLLLEVVMGYVSSPEGHQVIAFEHDGQVITGFPARLTESVTGIGLADINQDGNIEIVTGMTGGLIVLANDGSTLLQKRFDGGVYSEPVIGDIDADQQLDIVVSSFGSSLYSFDKTFNTVRHFPVRLNDGTFSTPVICDLNRDSKVDIGCTFLNANCYFWGLNGNYDERFLEWPTYRHDLYRSGNYHIKSRPSWIKDELIQNANLTRGIMLEITPNPAIKEAIISYTLDRKSLVELTIYDISGRCVFQKNEVELPGRYKISIGKKTLASGIYFCQVRCQNTRSVKKFVLVNF